MNENIRNFSIIAHIDHGKSSLAQKLVELAHCEESPPGSLKSSQLFDRMDLERERGITIKSQSCRILHKGYILNLIDTPGHVDFNYEVSRSLAASDGAILLVDASQGVQAQTISNLFLALDYNLEIIPVINKIDLPAADVNRVKNELHELFGFNPNDAIEISAKTGQGVPFLLDEIINRVPPPKSSNNSSLRALIFDSYFDFYKGAVAIVRIFDGSVKPGDYLNLLATDKSFEVTEVGFFNPVMTPCKILESGSVGYVCGSLKDTRDVRVGDTLTSHDNPAPPLAGYKEPLSMVFAGLFPVDSNDYQKLKDALEKLQLNDSALNFTPENSTALGFGFRCGFLGLLHMEIVQERLEREYNLSLIVTAPSVVYKVFKTDGQIISVQNPAELPPPQEIKAIQEPVVHATVIAPSDFIGSVMELAQNKRGTYVSMEYMDTQRVQLKYKMPLNEISTEFFFCYFSLR